MCAVDRCGIFRWLPLCAERAVTVLECVTSSFSQFVFLSVGFHVFVVETLVIMRRNMVCIFCMRRVRLCYQQVFTESVLRLAHVCSIRCTSAEDISHLLFAATLGVY